MPFCDIIYIMSHENENKEHVEELVHQAPQTEEKFNYLAIITLCLALAIVIIDGTVLNVSTNNIVQDLGATIKDITWAQTLYALILACLAILGGRVGDVIGRRKAFVIGALLFGVGSFITAISDSVHTLIFGWSIIEGLGAALMIPASSALILTNFSPKNRAKAFAFYGSTAGFASAVGPLLGGYLTSEFSWRWAFGINLFVVAALCAYAPKLKDFMFKTKADFDIAGFIFSAAGLGGLTYGIIESNFFYSLLGLISLIIFMLWEIKYESLGFRPLVSLKLFENRAFTFGIATTTVLFAGFAGIIFYAISLFYQQVLKLDAFSAGLGLIPLSIGSLISAPFSIAISNKISPRRTVQLGAVIIFVAILIMYNTLTLDSTRESLAPTLFVFGLGFGLLVSQLSAVTLSHIKVSEAGSASAVSGAIRDVGRTLGLSIIGAAFIAAAPNSFAVQEVNSVLAYKTALLYGLVFVFVSALLSFGIPKQEELKEEAHH